MAPSTDPNTSNKDNIDSSKKAVTIDRDVNTLIPSTTLTTPSSLSSIPPETELLHRLHGTSLIQCCSTLLEMKVSTFATACSIFQRFYHHESLKDHDVWSTAMACTLLSGKIEEDFRSVRKIVLIYSHLYRRRRLRVDDPHAGGTASDSESSLASKLNDTEKENVLRHVPPSSPLGQTYKEWQTRLFHVENVILRSLGFVLYWIPDSHPHKFILYFLKALSVEEEDLEFGRPLAQSAWNYCNDSCRLDLCVRFHPELVACASICMADKERRLPLNPKPWWEVFIGPDKSADLANVCNAILALQDEAISGRAMRTFVPSLMDGGSFNDPGSYLWELADRLESIN